VAVVREARLAKSLPACSSYQTHNTASWP